METTHKSGTATIAGHKVNFIPTHREGNDTAPMFQLNLTVPFSIEDAAAVLWIVVHGGMTFAELDDAYVRELIAETLVGQGGIDVADARLTMEEVRPGTAEYAIAAETYRRVRRAFGVAEPSASAADTPGALAGVA